MRRGVILFVGLFLCSCVLVQAQDSDFPKHGFLPKKETGALRFLEKNPELDGRGVVVAIFDTGVDPGAPGLQMTSDGKPKIVDMVDGSGSGDVDTSATRKAKDGKIVGLSGRTLLIPKSWKNKTGVFRVGLKPGFELFPRRLIPRVKRERKAKWDKTQARAKKRIRGKLNAVKKRKKLSAKAKAAQTKELTAQLSLIDKVTFNDPGPLFDCVVFHDGKQWLATVDTDEDGRLDDEKTMTNFRTKREFASFGASIMLNFAVNIYESGKLLSIVSDCGVHGTHVAGIVAAHFKDNPEMNGLAPGAQIVSVKIGDHRLGSSSTNTGQMRGLTAVLKNKCDLINMSYGGSTDDPNRGAIADLYTEIVRKKNVIFVASAGNSGPCLNTVGAPGGTTSAIIGVGAYVSPELAKASYSLNRQLKRETLYTWTSRGPTSDGDLGVNICAPGGAFAPVAKWSLDRTRLLNGTSMSSPNACGGIALILSGLKKAKVKYNPSCILRALQNTARPLKDHEAFGVGRGLIQIDAAYKHLTKHAKSAARLMRFQVSLPNRNGDRGIYLRDPVETKKLSSTRVQIRPRFPRGSKNKDRADFQFKFLLKCDAEWVTCPENLLMTNGGRTIRIDVDPTKLACGAHYTEVIGIDADDPDRGPMFRIPVTVVCPERLVKTSKAGLPRQTLTWRKKLKFQPGQIHRQFICIPRGATWVDFHVRAGNIENGRTMVVHAIEKTPRTGYPRSYHRHYISLKNGREASRTFAVTGGHTLELCLAQFWSNQQDGEFEFELNVHGIAPDCRGWSLDGSQLTARVEVVAPLREEQLSPVASLTKLRTTIRPSSAVVRQLKGQRDSYPGKTIQQLVLTYPFELTATATVFPRPAVSREDESWQTLQSQLWSIFDSNKRVHATGTMGRSARLSKGKYVVRFHVRHVSNAQLSRLKTMYLALDRQLARPITLKVYRDPDGALTGSDRYTGGTIACGQRQVLYLGMPRSYPSGSIGGDRLIGTLVFGKSNNQLRGTGSRPGGFPLQIVVPPQRSPSRATAKKGPAKLADRLWQAQFEHLQMLREKKKRKEFQTLAAKLEKSHKQHKKKIQIERLQMLDDADRKERLPKVVKAADAIIAKIDTKKMAAHYGVRLDTANKAAKKARQTIDKQKALLVDALYRKARAVAFMDLPPKPEDKGKKRPKHPAKKADRDKLFEATYAELAKWVDLTSAKYALLPIRRYRRQARLSEALKLLNTHLKRVPAEYRLFKKRADIYDELGWRHWAKYERKWMVIRFPKAYPPF